MNCFLCGQSSDELNLVNMDGKDRAICPECYQKDKDPLYGNHAVVDDNGPADMAENHDEYLYGDAEGNAFSSGDHDVSERHDKYLDEAFDHSDKKKRSDG